MLKVISAILFLDTDFVLDLLCLLNLRGQKGTTIKNYWIILTSHYHLFNMTKKAINTCNVISYVYNALQITTSLIQCTNRVWNKPVQSWSLKWRPHQIQEARKEGTAVWQLHQGYLYKNCVKEIMLIRTKRAQTLELILREHEQDIKSDVD